MGLFEICSLHAYLGASGQTSDQYGIFNTWPLHGKHRTPGELMKYMDLQWPFSNFGQACAPYGISVLPADFYPSSGQIPGHTVAQAMAVFIIYYSIS